MIWSSCNSAWHEALIDCMVLALHHLQSYYLTEIAWGQNGIGNYHLHPQFANLNNTIPMLPSPLCSPEEIVRRIKGHVEFTANENARTITNTEKPASNSQNSGQLSQRDRAMRVISESRISMDTKLHTFTVLESECPHVVTLFPKETCLCPSTSSCYHILAARVKDNSQPDTVTQKCLYYWTEEIGA